MARNTFYISLLTSVCISTALSQCLPPKTRCSGNEFCDDNSSCQSDSFASSTPTFNGILPNVGYQDSSGYSAFRVLMVSDIQYWYTNCKQQDSICLFTHKSDDVAALEDAAIRVKDCVESLKTSDTKLIIDGGDLTNVGDADEKYKYEEFRASLPTDIPIALTLGNHDYYMKGGLLSTTKQAARMITYLETNLVDLHNRANSMSGVTIHSADFAIAEDTVQGYGDTKFTKGSLMYTVEVEGIVFIIMHWAPSIKGTAYLDNFAVTSGCPNPDYKICETNSRKNEYFEITNGFRWLTSQMRKINKANKNAVLVPHFVNPLVDYLKGGARSNLRKYIDESVVAVLTGHDHDQWGFWGSLFISESSVPIMAKDDTGGIPVFYSGSASYETMIYADFAYDRTVGTVSIDVKAVTTAENMKCAVVPDDNSDVETPTPSPASP